MESEGQNGPGSVHDYPQTDVFNVGTIGPTNKSNEHGFFNYMIMKPLRTGPKIQKSDTNFRIALEPGLELARTQRVLSEAWQTRQGWLCLNSTVAAEARWS